MILYLPISNAKARFTSRYTVYWHTREQWLHKGSQRVHDHDTKLSCWLETRGGRQMFTILPLFLKHEQACMIIFGSWALRWLQTANWTKPQLVMEYSSMEWSKGVQLKKTRKCSLFGWGYFIINSQFFSSVLPSLPILLQIKSRTCDGGTWQS